MLDVGVRQLYDTLEVGATSEAGICVPNDGAAAHLAPLLPGDALAAWRMPLGHLSTKAALDKELADLGTDETAAVPFWFTQKGEQTAVGNESIKRCSCMVR